MDLTHDQIGASLAFATHQMAQNLQAQEQAQMSQEAQNTPQEPQDTPQTQETPEPNNEPQTQDTEPNELDAKFSELELNLTNKLDEIRKELKSDNSKEIEGIKKNIEDALK